MSTFEPQLAREVRDLPTEAPAALRARVRALGEPERHALPRLAPRRTMLVVLPTCVLALVAAAAIHGVLSSSPTRRETFAGVGAVGERANSGGSAAVGRPSLSPRAPATSKNLPAVIPPPSAARHQDYAADLRVRVDDLDALGRRTADAMQVTRTLGGYVASVSQSTSRGEPGEADLVLRVPVGRVDEAMIRLSALGTVLDEHVSIVDVENTVRQQRLHIRALKLQILRLTAALRQSLPADVRLRLQFQLDDARRNLVAATGASTATLREAALARISLSLTTERRVGAAKHHSGRFGSAVSGAVGFLAAAGAIALAILIVLAPLAILVALVLWGARAFRRRSEARLLATP